MSNKVIAIISYLTIISLSPLPLRPLRFINLILKILVKSSYSYCTITFKQIHLKLKNMTKYVMWGSYCEDVLEKRAPFREAHLAGLATQKESGVLITIGPTKDLTKVFAIYEAEDEAAVRQLVEADPYWVNKVWTEYDVKEWIQAF